VTAGERPIVLALPRGGVPVGYEVATALAAPLDVFVVRKLGVPGHEELAMGAIASGGTVVLNDRVLAGLDIRERTIEEVVRREGEELERRQRAYRDDRPLPDLGGRTVVLVDDGLATGATMRAAVEAVKQHNPGRVVVAVPVASSHTVAELRADVDDVIVLAMPSPFYAVGQAYADFSQTTDDEVRDLLEP
jgi:predicted phosphoribosyltransferase